MTTPLLTRVTKLETMAGINDEPAPKFVRLVVSDKEEAEAIREAGGLGYDTSEGGTDILLIRLVPGERRREEASEAVA